MYSIITYKHITLLTLLVMAVMMVPAVGGMGGCKPVRETVGSVANSSVRKVAIGCPKSR